MSDLLNDWQHTRTYADEDQLRRGLARHALNDIPGTLIVRTPDGRWTAVFGKSFLGHNFMHVAQLGFKVLG